MGDGECLEDTTLIFFLEISLGLRVAGTLLMEGCRL